jgi:hypothetical protein
MRRCGGSAPPHAPCSDSLSLRLHGSLDLQGWSGHAATCRLTWRDTQHGASTCDRHPLAGSFFKRHAVRRWRTPSEEGTAGRPPTACRYRVSGSLSFPSRGAFHLSLTVLVPYRWPRVCAPWRVVPPASHRISRVPWYSGIQPHPSRPSPTGLSPSMVGLSSKTLRLTSLPGYVSVAGSLDPTTPAIQPVCRLDPGLGRQAVSLATTAALSHLIPLPRGTEMFQFPRCPSRRLCIQRPMRGVAAARVAPFGVAWLIARLQLPRHVSPLSASFLGSWPLRHPPCTPTRLARFPSAASVCCAAILLARFGKIEVIHDMWLFKCLKLSSC